MSEFKKRDLSDFYNKEFKNFALYSIHSRAIPNLLDGMKPVHRKIIWTAEKKAKKPIKTVSLVGYMMALADYKHGDQAALGSVINMASDWRNNVGLLNGYGNFGFRLIPDAGAPRYTKVQLNKSFYDWFSDFNALQYTPGDDGKMYEPDCYYANVPWFLINGISGIATGYSVYVHPRNPENLIKIVLEIIAGNNPDPGLLDIEYPSYDGKIENGYSLGGFKQLSAKKIAITALPVDYTIDTFATKLTKLVDKGTIRNFHKTVAEDKPPFVVDLKSQLKNPESTLGLKRKLKQETLTFLYDGHIMKFNDPMEAVTVFVQERVKIAEQGIRASKISREDAISRIETKIKFVEKLAERGLENLKRADMVQIISGLPRPDMMDSLLSMAASSLTEENIDTWKSRISVLKEEIEKLSIVTPSKWLKYNILNKPLT